MAAYLKENQVIFQNLATKFPIKGL